MELSKGRYAREECLSEVTELELQEKSNALDVGRGRGSSQRNRVHVSPYRNSNQAQQSLRHIEGERQGNTGRRAISTCIVVGSKKMQSIWEEFGGGFSWHMNVQLRVMHFCTF
jgi:hypothetical protein